MKGTVFVTPPDQEYDAAPPPVSVTLAPAQTAAAVLVAVTIGSEFTVIVLVVVFVQPFELVPVTV